jgi:hypothetical protein
MKKALSRLTLIAALVAMACGGSNPVTPPTPTTTLAPVPSPSVAPSPSSPATLSCTLPELPENDNCYPNKNGRGELQEQATAAVARVRELKPNFFNGQEIVAPEKYMILLQEVLETEFGLCAARRMGNSDEMRIKKNNNFHENYDFIAGGRNGEAIVNWSYMVTCIPAGF